VLRLPLAKLNRDCDLDGCAAKAAVNCFSFWGTTNAQLNRHAVEVRKYISAIMVFHKNR
jgi:hypothetical protein